MAKMEQITRKSMLYETEVEYGDWAMNHVQGCAHDCRYPCYAYLMARRFGRAADHDDWAQPKLVSNTIELLKKELPRKASKIKQVQLCFTTDPFMTGYPEVAEMSKKAIKVINGFGVPCVVLTKGVLPDNLANTFEQNMYGITLVSLDEEFRKEMEPGAAPIEDRLKALKVLHDAGCKTWVSMEPYPTPNICEQDISVILGRISFVDRIVFGRVHYDKRTNAYGGVDEFYRECAATVRGFCEERGIDCHIKKGTAD